MLFHRRNMRNVLTHFVVLMTFLNAHLNEAYHTNQRYIDDALQ